MEKLIKALDIIGSGLDILTALAFIGLASFIAYLVLGIVGMTGLLQILGTGLIGILGGLLMHLVMKVFLSVFS